MDNNANSTINNSEILLLYEAKLCNPNGDPDDENRPRIDPKTRINLVSDVRLKRFFRNYIIDRYGEGKIWVSTVDGKHVDATERVSKLTTPDKDIVESVLENCIDARLFGATIPLKGGKKGDKRGESHSIIGPVQFTWGYSLHPVEIVDSSTITSMFKGRETEAEAGTIGKDYRVYYSLIAFYGVINGMRARDSQLKKEDILILDNMLWDSIVIDATTRSKIGHTPHLYLRIEYKETSYLHGDLRKYIQVSQQENKPIRDLSDLNVNLQPLIDYLTNNSNRISAIYKRTSEYFDKYFTSNTQNNKLNIIELPHSNTNITL